LTPLSKFLGQPAPRPLPLPPYPGRLIYWLAARWYEPIGPGRGDAVDSLGLEEQEASAAGFITYLNLLMGQLQPSPAEKELLARFARIGIGPNRPFKPEALKPEIRQAIEKGVSAGYDQIRDEFRNLGDFSRNGWQFPYTMFGTPEQMRGRYLRRAAAAMYGLYGNSLPETLYPFAIQDAKGQPLDASKHKYVLKLRKEDIPPVSGFWSLTMYYWPQEFLVHNPIQRYSLGDRTPGVKYEADGSLTIYLQHQSPGKDKEANWLPAPKGKFALILRMYGPTQTPPSIIDGSWTPSPVRRTRQP
jgi:hypothetical protein